MRLGYCIVYNGRMVPYQLCDGLAISLTACDRPEQRPLRRAFVWMRGSRDANISFAVAFAFRARDRGNRIRELLIQNLVDNAVARYRRNVSSVGFDATRERRTSLTVSVRARSSHGTLRSRAAVLSAASLCL